MDLSDLSQKVLANIYKLIEVKKAQVHNPETAQEERRKILFSISSYEKWIQAVKQQQITSLPIEENDSKMVALLMKEPYKFTKGLANRFLEVIKYGAFEEFKDSPPQMLVETQPAKPENTKIEVFNTVEAIPKKLAEEGDRPGDEDPLGQKIWDLELITGIGGAKGKELAEQGITLELLLNDWKKYQEEDELHGCLETISFIGQPKLRFNDLVVKLSKYSDALPKLTHHQLIGVKYFHDIKLKIPRAEIVKTEKYLQTLAHHLNAKFHLQCCGSYRRGKDKSGDIDCLVYHEELLTADDVNKFESENGSILHSFVSLLTSTGFLTDHLSIGDTKYMGVGHLPGKEYTINRRIDIRFVPANSFGASLLYFTGSKNFNTMVRGQCLKKGYTLSEYGLFKIKTDSNGKPIKDPKTKTYTKCELYPIKTEMDFFQFLEMEYKTPKERDI